MWTDQAMLKLSEKETYNRETLFRLLRGEKPDLSESAFRWTLYNLQKEQKIYRAGRDSYTTSKPELLPIYQPVYSEEAKAVSQEIAGRYPEIDFVVYESVLLNEFLNHQIAQNTIYIQTEKDISSYIFNLLQEEYAGNVLYKPSKSEFDRYWTRGCFVVLDLISQSPLSKESPHEMTVEKLLVDIIAEKSIAATFSPAELLYVFENVRESCRIDRHRLNRYAGRRGKTAQINKLMGGA